MNLSRNKYKLIAMKNILLISFTFLVLVLTGISCTKYPIDEDGLLITGRIECYVSNFELLNIDFQTVRSTSPVIDTIAQTIDIEVYWGTNLKKLWPQFSLVTDAKLDPKITDWVDFSDLSNPRQWAVISGNRKIKKTYSVNITVQPKP
jgi:RNAse (barnase) inhibitor barstar